MGKGELNGLALCAGVGGLELGLRLALGETYRTVCYVEREAFAAATLVARMEDETLDRAPIWDDVATFRGSKWSGCVDLVSAGFPCQPFSVAGKRRGIQDDRWLWPHIARIVGETAPGMVFLENVPGIVGHGLEIVWSDLRRMGYKVEAGFFSAAEVGAPHRRQRLFVLAYRQPWKHSGQDGFLPTGSSQRDVADAGCISADGEQPGWSSRSCWPYPPNFSGTWPPGLEPAICRMVDGFPNRVDRLRALGNGVVPLVAAYAFKTLMKRVVRKC